MKKQNFEIKNEKIRTAFENLKKNNSGKLKKRLNLSWSNWGFGIESLEDTAKRLQKNGIQFIELHGNHYGPDLGYKPKETLKILGDHNIKVAGICGMFSPDNDLSSNRAIHKAGGSGLSEKRTRICCCSQRQLYTCSARCSWQTSGL